MCTVCRLNSDRFLTLSLLMLISILICACGGGEESSGRDPNPNVPQADRWDRFDVVQIEGEPLTPNIRAVIDNLDRIHVFYYTRGEKYDTSARYQINHVVWDAATDALVDEGEILQVQTATGDNADSGLNNCLLMDVGLTTDGSPLVAYQGGRIPGDGQELECNETQQGDLMLNLFNGAGWDEYMGIYGYIRHKNPLFIDGYVGLSGSIAVDSQNTIHMAAQCYYEMCDLIGLGYPDLMYVKQDMNQLQGNYDTSWEEFVDDSNDFVGGGADVISQMGYFCQLVLDENDNPIIIYVGTPNQDSQGEDRISLRMARKVGGQWQTEVIQVLVDWEILSLSAAVAPDGTIGVAYYMRTLTDTDYPDHLKYAFRQLDGGGEWEFDIVDVTSHCGDHNSIVFDSNSRPLIAYYDIHSNSGKYRGRYDLRFARSTGPSAWQKETVASAGDIGKYNTIWVDDQDVPHICTYEQNNQQIVIFKEKPEV